jgi:hypothetical protein
MQKIVYVTCNNSTGLKAFNGRQAYPEVEDEVEGLIVYEVGDVRLDLLSAYGVDTSKCSL